MKKNKFESCLCPDDLDKKIKLIRGNFFPEQRIYYWCNVINKYRHEEEIVARIIQQVEKFRKRWIFWGELILASKEEILLEVRARHPLDLSRHANGLLVSFSETLGKDIRTEICKTLQT